MALVGIADVFIVGFVGEAAVSGVSLVNSFNTIFLYLFVALASGGAVVISQYIGNGEREEANCSASQLLLSSMLFSIVIMAVVLLWNRPILQGLFGEVEADVMEACVIYLRISAYSYPALAMYNAGAALYRSMGKPSTTMYLSIASNVINIVGNCIGVFGLHAGVLGVAVPSLISRWFSAVVITALCFRKEKNKESLPDDMRVNYDRREVLRFNGDKQKKILGIAIPNGVESGIFQLVKVALSSVVALFGTYQIAANGVAQTIWSLASLVCVTMGPVFITVIGQCMGAGEVEQASYYFRKLMKITIVCAIIWNGFIFAITPMFMSFYAISDEAKQLTILLVLIHNVVNALVFPFADPLGKGLRACGDVGFTTIVSLFTTIGVRLIFSYIFAIGMQMGVIGIAIAMCLDWTVRGLIYEIRFRRGAWKSMHVI